MKIIVLRNKKRLIKKERDFQKNPAMYFIYCFSFFSGTRNINTKELKRRRKG